jgi:hypothetical protein
MPTKFTPPFNPTAHGWLCVTPDLYLRLIPRGCVTIERDDWGWSVVIRHRDDDASAIAAGLFMSEALRDGGRAVGYERSHHPYMHPRPWRAAPPTVDQLKTLKKIGYMGDPPATKGEAWDLIGAYCLARQPISRWLRQPLPPPRCDAGVFRPVRGSWASLSRMAAS